jgi:ribonuclease-3
MRRFFEGLRRRFRFGAPADDAGVRFAHVERRIGYRFRVKERLIEALTHRSTLGELAPGEERITYERLEFLGDSVLSLVTSDYLLRRYPDEDEGQLTKKKSLLVSQGVLVKQSEELGLKDHIIVSENASRSGVPDQDSVQTATLEALIGAIYLDGGLESARRFVERWILRDIDEFLEHRDHINYKSLLQEHTQTTYRSYPMYRVESTTGPEHNKIFVVNVLVDGRVLGKGRGRSKKDAEQMAAKEAMGRLDETPENRSQ